MATFTSMVYGPYSASATFSGLTKVSYARTVYIKLKGVSPSQQKDWIIAANATPGAYTRTFTNLQRDTTYTAEVIVYKNSPWGEVHRNTTTFTTEDVFVSCVPSTNTIDDSISATRTGRTIDLSVAVDIYNDNKISAKGTINSYIEYAFSSSGPWNTKTPSSSNNLSYTVSQKNTVQKNFTYQIAGVALSNKYIYIKPYATLTSSESRIPSTDTTKTVPTHVSRNIELKLEALSFIYQGKDRLEVSREGNTVTVVFNTTIYNPNNIDVINGAVSTRLNYRFSSSETYKTTEVRNAEFSANAGSNAYKSFTFTIPVSSSTKTIQIQPCGGISCPASTYIPALDLGPLITSYYSYGIGIPANDIFEIEWGSTLTTYVANGGSTVSTTIYITNPNPRTVTGRARAKYNTNSAQWVNINGYAYTTWGANETKQIKLHSTAYSLNIYDKDNISFLIDADLYTYNSTINEIKTYTPRTNYDTVGTVRPSKFYWISNGENLLKGKPVSDYITAAKWNQLQININAVRLSKKIANYSFTSVSKGDNITAALYNQIADAINEMKSGTITKVASGDSITAAKMTALQNGINSIT